MDNILKFKQQVKKLPLNPGIYIMKDYSGKIIYIGKAKNLKNRVSSYFMNDSGHSNKVKKMVSNIAHFDYIVTDSEFEALVLECSLIKKHQPKYNILLKDDKGFSYIKITNEIWPRIFYSKQKTTDKDNYIGPYVNSFAVKKMVEEVTRIFKIPTCNRDLNKVFKRPCLNYYINRCCAPCTRAISHSDYLRSISDATKFLKNGISRTLESLKKTMQIASDNLNFEYAAQIRDRMKAIENIKNKQKVVAYKIKNQDVIATAHDEKNVSFEVFKFRGGDLCENQNFIIEPESSDLAVTRAEFLKQYYGNSDIIPKNITIDGEIADKFLIEKYLSDKSGSKVNFILPKKGEQFNLVQMCAKNAEESLLRSKSNKNETEDTLEELRNVLKLNSIPKRIEAYDISNLMGSDNVGGMIVYKNGKPLKKAYRKFKIKNIIGQDDYGSIREVISRRILEYLNSSEKNSKKIEADDSFFDLPDLILIDGGITHTRAASEILAEFGINIPVFGMVKDSKHRTRALTTDGREIEIKKYNRLFNFITRIQDEVHRFTINYHKNLRNKKIISSELLKIPGVGPARAKILLNEYGSIDNIAEATVEKLESIGNISRNIAENIYKFFNK